MAHALAMGERHDAAFGFVAPTDLSSAGSKRGGIRAEPDAIALPGRLSAAMPKAQSNEPHLREAVAKGLWEARQAGPVAAVASRSPDPLPVRKCMRGPKNT